MKLLFTISFLTLAISLAAQYPSTTVGLRAGGVSGFSMKYIDEDLKGVEVIAGWQENGFRLVGLVQQYKPIATDRLANLYMITGVGVHSGYVRYSKHEYRRLEEDYYYYGYNRTAPIFGGDFLLGIEYHFESIPLHFTIDYKPYFQLFGERKFRVDLWDLGFSFRYVLNN